jgi:hypothetical protein
MNDFENKASFPKTPQCPSRLTLALSLVPNELSNQESDRLNQHVAACQRCQTLLTALEKERKELYQKLPNLPMLPVQKLWLLRPVWLSAMAVFVLLVAILAIWKIQSLEPAVPAVHFKGSTPQLLYRVERQGTVFPGKSYMELQPGDRLRFAYSVDDAAYLTIVSLDQTGRLSWYYPSIPAQSIPIFAGQEVFLDGSIRLDDFLGLERIYAIFSRTPLSAQQIDNAVKELEERHSQRPWDIESLPALPLPGTQQSILIHKVKKHEP